VYLEPGVALIASGNRVRIAWQQNPLDKVYTCNGGRAFYFDTEGDQPLVMKAPLDAAVALKERLLKGRCSESIVGVNITLNRAAASLFDPYPEYTETSGYTLGTDKSGSPTLSYIVNQHGLARNDGYPVTIHYDPTSFAILRIESRIPTTTISPGSFVVHFDTHVPVSDDLFRIPEDPQIRISRARAELTAIRTALDLYLIDNKSYPTTSRGLQALRREPAGAARGTWKGPYLGENDPLVDPWGNPYSYKSPRPGINPEGYDLSSWGYDEKPDTPDDIHR
jgi:type II secretion system protein G